MDVLDENEYVEYFQALEKFLANYHTTIWTPRQTRPWPWPLVLPLHPAGVDAAAPLEGAAAPAERAGKAKVCGINPDACA